MASQAMKESSGIDLKWQMSFHHIAASRKVVKPAVLRKEDHLF
jgi:hypothetical protein